MDITQLSPIPKDVNEKNIGKEFENVLLSLKKFIWEKAIKEGEKIYIGSWKDESFKAIIENSNANVDYFSPESIPDFTKFCDLLPPDLEKILRDSLNVVFINSAAFLNKTVICFADFTYYKGAFEGKDSRGTAKEVGLLLEYNYTPKIEDKITIFTRPKSSLLEEKDLFLEFPSKDRIAIKLNENKEGLYFGPGKLKHTYKYK